MREITQVQGKIEKENICLFYNHKEIKGRVIQS